MYYLIEYRDIYQKRSESLWQYHRDGPTLNNGNTIDFPANNNSISFKFKQEITGQQETMAQKMLK